MIDLNYLNWKQILALCLAKRDYQVEYRQWRELGWKRFFHRWPMDPCRGTTADRLALRYTQEYNKVYSGKSDPLPGGGLVTVRLRYDADSLCPVISLCYDDNDSPRNDHYQMNWKINRDGSLQRIPEMLDTEPFENIPGKTDIPELAKIEEDFWNVYIENLKNVVLNWKLIALL